MAKGVWHWSLIKLLSQKQVHLLQFLILLLGQNIS